MRWKMSVASWHQLIELFLSDTLGYNCNCYLMTCCCLAACKQLSAVTWHVLQCRAEEPLDSGDRTAGVIAAGSRPPQAVMLKAGAYSEEF